METPEPKRVAERTLTLLPSCTNCKTESTLPIRTVDLKDRPEPNCKKPKILVVDPRFILPCIDIPEESLATARSDKPEPHCKNDNTEAADPKRANARRDIELPAFM